MSDKNLPAIKGIEEIESVVCEALSANDETGAALVGSMRTAQAIKRLAAFFYQEDVKPMLAMLQGSDLGFRTDKDDKGGYDHDTLVKCAIDGLLNGYRITGNEINIISGRYMPVKNGVWRKINDNPHITNFRYSLDPPENSGGRSIVRARASWLYDGERQTIGVEQDDPCLIPVKMNSASTDDNTQGKAKRKLFARILERATGVSIPEVDEESMGVVSGSVNSKPISKAQSLIDQLPEAAEEAKAEEPKQKDPQPEPKPESKGEPAQAEQPAAKQVDPEKQPVPMPSDEFSQLNKHEQANLLAAQDLGEKETMGRLVKEAYLRLEMSGRAREMIKGRSDATSKGYPKGLNAAENSKNALVEVTRLNVQLVAEYLANEETKAIYMDIIAKSPDYNGLVNIWNEIDAAIKIQNTQQEGA